MGRGRGKGKRGGRGGGVGRQHFVSSLEELEARNEKEDAWNARRRAEREEGEESDPDKEKEEIKESERGVADKDGDGDKEGEEDSGDEREDDDEKEDQVEKNWAASRQGVVALEEVERKPKPKGVSGLIEIENPNAKPKATRMMKAKVSIAILGWPRFSTIASRPSSILEHEV